MRCQDLTCSSPDVLGGLSSLQKLVVSRCGRITSLPDCLGDLTSLEELRIHKCRRIKALPDSIQQLTNLQRIVISSCPDLELWCQSEENKMKLAHIKELVCALPIHPL
jgi:Leucine-rich repeat (LRR) protein